MIAIAKTVGPIRVGEIRETRIASIDQLQDQNTNFLDLKGLKWRIVSRCTKSKRCREFDISEEASVEIQKHLRWGQRFLLENGSGGMITDDSNISKPIKRHVGTSWGVIRKSYINGYFDGADSTHSDRIVNVLGHRPKTQVSKYLVSNSGCLV